MQQGLQGAACNKWKTFEKLTIKNVDSKKQNYFHVSGVKQKHFLLIFCSLKATKEHMILQDATSGVDKGRLDSKKSRL